MIKVHLFIVSHSNFVIPLTKYNFYTVGCYDIKLKFKNVLFKF